VFQSADFGNVSKEPAEREEGARGNARMTHVLGMTRSFLAARGILRCFPEGEDDAAVLRADLEAVYREAVANPAILQAHRDKREDVNGHFASADDGLVVSDGRGLRAIDLWEGLDDKLTG
jgi:hypothetical protein